MKVSVTAAVPAASYRLSHATTSMTTVMVRSMRDPLDVVPVRGVMRGSVLNNVAMDALPMSHSAQIVCVFPGV